MNFEDELRKFIRTDIPLRQMRESARWHIEIWVEDAHIVGEARDVSRGGLGAVVRPDAVWQKRLVIGREVRLSFLWEGAKQIGQVSARVIWIQKDKDVWGLGFEFLNLDAEADIQIERYLLSQVIRRNLEDERET